MQYDEFGRELPDDTPIEVPVGLKRPPTLHEMIAMHVRGAMFQQKVQEAGFESEEEANDFEVDGDDLEELPMTPHEIAAQVGDDLGSHIKTKKVDRSRRMRHDDPTVNRDRIKESQDVHERRTGDDREGVGNGGEKRGASGGERRSAGDGGGRVSEVSGRGDRAVSKGGDADG